MAVAVAVMRDVSLVSPVEVPLTCVCVPFVLEKVELEVGEDVGEFREDCTEDVVVNDKDIRTQRWCSRFLPLSREPGIRVPRLSGRVVVELGKERCR